MPASAVSDSAGATDANHRHPRLNALIERARTAPPLRTAAVFPCEASALQATADAASRRLIEPVLYGPAAVIQALADRLRLALPGRMVDCGDDPRAAAAAAVADAAAGRVQAIMKGSLHTDELLEAVVNRDAGLRMSGRMTHTFVFDAPSYPKMLAVSDAVVNVAPDVKTKAESVRNGCFLLRRIGVAQPRVAVVAAIELVNPAIPATVDAAEIVRLAQLGRLVTRWLRGRSALITRFRAKRPESRGSCRKSRGNPT